MLIRTITSALIVLTISGCGGGFGLTPSASAPQQQVRPSLVAIGNSITYHECVPEIGWCNDWGMAAPSAEQDYVHLVAKGINASSNSIYNIASAEVNPPITVVVANQIAEVVNENSVIIVQLGDNVNLDSLPVFRIMYRSLLASVMKGKKVVCISTFWVRPSVDSLMHEECLAAGAKWVFIGDIYGDPANPDRNLHPYSNAGVNEHPQKWSMAQIGERVIKVAKD